MSVYSSFPAILLRAIPYQDVLRTPNATELSTILQEARICRLERVYMTFWSDAWLVVLPTPRTSLFDE